jgi:hypothetical protein
MLGSERYAPKHPLGTSPSVIAASMDSGTPGSASSVVRKGYSLERRCGGKGKGNLLLPGTNPVRRLFSLRQGITFANSQQSMFGRSLMTENGVMTHKYHHFHAKYGRARLTVPVRGRGLTIHRERGAQGPEGASEAGPREIPRNEHLVSILVLLSSRPF